MASAGLSQLELDALCCHQGPEDEPSSPIGSMLCARKRSRQCGRRSQEILEEASLHAASTNQSNDADGACGLSQKVLDAMAIGMEMTEDSSSSPIGCSLRRAKNRRRWGQLSTEDLAAEAVQEQENEEQALVPVVHDPAASPLRFPVSWGAAGGGLSQVALDEMSGTNVPDDAPSSPDHRSRDSPRLSRSPQQQRRRVQRVSGAGMSASTQKADAENLGENNTPGKLTPGRITPGKITPAGSPDKNVESSSPWSPQRRSNRLGLNPLSPALLN